MYVFVYIFASSFSGVLLFALFASCLGNRLEFPVSCIMFVYRESMHCHVPFIMTYSTLASIREICMRCCKAVHLSHFKSQKSVSEDRVGDCSHSTVICCVWWQ